jgi:ABC-type transport system substrate-binding protein
MQHLIGRIGVLVVAVLCAGACTAPGARTNADGRSAVTTLDDGSVPVRGGKLMIGLTAESSGWSPVADQWALDGHFVASTIYDTLTAVAPDRSIVPELAEVVEHDETFTRWTLHLRRNITFHDGTPFDAAAVKANLDASRRGLGAIALAPIDDVQVVDPVTVVVTMKTPWSAFPGTLAGQQGYMAAPSTLDDGSASTAPIGTGPFAFDEWSPDHHLRVARNDRYWQRDRPYLDEIEFQPMADNASRSAALESGALDLFVTYDPADAGASQSAGHQVVTDHRAEETVVVLNAGRPPFDDPDVRRAVTLATDQAVLIETLGAGVLEPADGPFAEGEPWYSADTHQPPFDLEEARVLAAEYRARTGGPLRFRLTTFPDPTRLRQAQLLQQMWSMIGAEVQIQTLDQASFIDPLIHGGLEAAIISNFGPADPDFNYLFWHSSLVGGPGELSINFSHTADEQIDAALDAARRTDDVRARAREYQTVTRRLNDEMAYIWLYRTPTTIVATSRVRGLSVLGDAGFGRPDVKPWLAHLWIDTAAG